MKVEIVQVKEEEKVILSNLLQLYLYDFSEFENNDVNFLGLYDYSYVDNYFTEANRYAYFIKVDGNLAGFVMVSGVCYVSKDSETLFISEFFVMKKYRRQKIGKYAVTKVLKMHPGKWEIAVHPANVIGYKFWTSIINDIAKEGTIKIINNVENIYEDALATICLFTI